MLPNPFPQQKQVFHWNKNGHFSWILPCNFTQARVLFNTIIWAVHITFRQLLSQVRHDRSMRLVDWTTSTLLSWSHRLKRGDVIQFLKRWKEVRWNLWWAGHNSETKAVSHYSRSWDASHCSVEGKATCQSDLFEYVSSICVEFCVALILNTATSTHTFRTRCKNSKPQKLRGRLSSELSFANDHQSGEYFP
jgi:hypothetical protein